MTSMLSHGVEGIYCLSGETFALKEIFSLNPMQQPLRITEMIF